MTTKGKIATGGAILVGSGLTFWFIRRQVRKARVTKVQRETVEASTGAIDIILKNNLKVPPGERVLPSYGDAQMKAFADTLESAMDGAGTTEEDVEEVFNAMNNNLDVLLLIEAFGVRDDENLAKWLQGDGMTKSVNSILKTKGRITYRF